MDEELARASRRNKYWTGRRNSLRAADGGCALFQWVRTPRAAHLHELLARQGILTRLFDTPASLRFGLPGRESGWERLDAALASTSHQAEQARLHLSRGEGG